MKAMLNSTTCNQVTGSDHPLSTPPGYNDIYYPFHIEILRWLRIDAQ